MLSQSWSQPHTNTSFLTSLITERAKLLNSNWLRQTAFFINFGLPGAKLLRISEDDFRLQKIFERDWKVRKYFR